MSDSEFGAGRSKKIDDFLYKHISSRHYKFWIDFTSQFPLPFHKQSSSSGKYHLNKAGLGHTIEDHTLELIYFVDRLITIFGDTKEEQGYDIMILAAALHDCMKYGAGSERKHTVLNHGDLVAGRIRKQGVQMGLTEHEAEMLASMVEFHMGRWSTSNPYPNNAPIIMTDIQLFLHVADMASSRRILKFD